MHPEHGIRGYLMSLGFTKRWCKSQPYYKVVGDSPWILVMYIDDLFHIGAEQLIVGCERELDFVLEMEDLSLLDWDWWCSWWDLPISREVCRCDLEQIWHDEQHVCDYTFDEESGEVVSLLLVQIWWILQCTYNGLDPWWVLWWQHPRVSSWWAKTVTLGCAEHVLN